MRIVVDVRASIRETASTGQYHVPFDATMPVKPAPTRRRQTARHVNGTLRPQIVLFPNGIVGSEHVVDDRCMHGEGAYVK